MSYEDAGFQAITSRVMNAVRGEASTPADMQALHLGLGGVIAILGGYIGYQKYVDWKLSKEWLSPPVEARYYEYRRVVATRELNERLAASPNFRALQASRNYQDRERYQKAIREMDPDLYDAEERVQRGRRR